MTPIWTVRSRDWRTPSGSTRDKSAAPRSRLFVQEGMWRRSFFTKNSKDRMDKLRVGDRFGQVHRLGSDRRPRAQLQSITNLVEDGLQGRGDGPRRSLRTSRTAGCFYPLPSSTEVDPACRLDAGRDLLDPFWLARPSERPRRRWLWPTIPAMDWPLRFGPKTSTLPLIWPPRSFAEVAWINSTNQFDASAGFGRRRESGFGREGGWEGPRRRRPTASLSVRRDPRNHRTQDRFPGSGGFRD